MPTGYMLMKQLQYTLVCIESAQGYIHFVMTYLILLQRKKPTKPTVNISITTATATNTAMITTVLSLSVATGGKVVIPVESRSRELARFCALLQSSALKSSCASAAKFNKGIHDFTLVGLSLNQSIYKSVVISIIILQRKYSYHVNYISFFNQTSHYA